MTRVAAGEDCFRTKRVLSSLGDSSYEPFAEEKRRLELLFKGLTDLDDNEGAMEGHHADARIGKV